MKWSSSHRRDGLGGLGSALLAGVLLFAAGCSGIHTMLTPEAKRFVEEGEKLESEKKVKEAVAKFNSAIDADPNCVAAYQGLARCCDRLGALEEAESALKRAVKLRPRDPELYHCLGVIYAKQGEFVEAVANLKRAVRYNSQNPRTHVFLGLVYFKQGKNKAAVREYQKALRMDPECAEAYNNMGIVYGAMKQLEDAEAAYLKAEQADPNYPDVHYNLGRFYDDVLPNKAEALRHYQRYLDITKQQDPKILQRMQEILRENLR